jgi:hypothetical protein
MLYLWISAINLIGIALGSAVSTNLSSNLLSRILLNHDATEWFKVLTSLAICGAAQGFILAGPQTIVLKTLDATPKVIQCFWITVVSMAVGITLPTLYGLVVPSNLIYIYISNLILIGFLLSWLLAGLFWGGIVGRTKKQKICWGLMNAGAYSLWGIAGFTIWLGMPLAIDTRESGLTELAFGLAALGIGLGLNSFVFRELFKDQCHNRIG